MDLAALKSEIALSEYNGLSDAEIASAIMVKSFSITVDTPAASVQGTLYVRGKWSNIVKRANAARANVDTTAAGLAAQSLYDMVQRQGVFVMTIIPVADQVAADLDTLVTAGDIIQDDKKAVLNLATMSITGAKRFGDLNSSDIVNARAS